MEISVLIPAHQAEATLPLCLCALLDAGFLASDILVVDDGSRDRTGAIARDLGVRVLRNETPLRPANARNMAADAANDQADILLFVDSDVMVHPDIRNRLLDHFKQPDIEAVIGSYDDRPTGPVVSRYRNLLHHFVHSRSGGAVDTFWTGLGAVRRAVFNKVGGFDQAWEDIEDVEFGLRLSHLGGAIILDPLMQGTHLKQWTVKSMFLTDVWGRAVPWTRLLLLGRVRTGTLNTSFANKLSALAVASFILLLLAAVTLSSSALLGLPGATALFLGANAQFILKLSSVGGPIFALRALPYHVLHYVAALYGYTYVRLMRWPTPR